jgi:phage baseplate assembly protein W
MALYGKKPTNSAIAGVISAPTEKVTGLRWAYKLTDSQVPYFNKLTSRELVETQMRQLLLTHKGERVMLPDYGLSLRNLLFQPLTSELVTTAAEDIEVSVNKYLPGVHVLKVSITQSENMYGYGIPGIHVGLLYRIRSSSQILDIKVKI